MMEDWNNGILGLGRMERVISAIISPEIYRKMDNTLEEATFQHSSIPLFRDHGKNSGLKNVIYHQLVEEISRSIRLLREPIE